VGDSNLPANFSPATQASFLCRDFAGPVRLPIARSADRRPAPIAGLSFPVPMTPQTGSTHAVCARNRANTPGEPLRLGRFGGNGNAELTKGSGHQLTTGRSPSSAEQDQAGAARSPETRRSSKMLPRERPRLYDRRSRRWVGVSRKQANWYARYSGSDDLAPSFIKRRDRRCRKCFSKRYGSAAGAKKAKR
jgi:hypothetical protein